MGSAMGWIKVHRQITDNWLWTDKPFSRGQAFIDLLMRANHCPAKFVLGNQLVEVQRGQLITSELKLMDAWGWSKAKVRGFLDVLEKDGMIEKKTDTKKTTLTICNYGSYQGSETAERLPADHRETAERLQKDTNKNGNNNKNEKNNTPELFGEDEVLPEKLRTEEFNKTWAKWEKVRREKRNTITPTTKKEQMEFLATQSDPIAVLNQSIKNGWTGLFEVNGKRKGDDVAIPQYPEL